MTRRDSEEAFHVNVSTVENPMNDFLKDLILENEKLKSRLEAKVNVSKFQPNDFFVLDRNSGTFRRHFCEVC